MEAGRSKALLQRQLDQVGALPALSLSAQEAARLQGFLDGEEVRALLLPTPLCSQICTQCCVLVAGVCLLRMIQQTYVYCEFWGIVMCG